MTPLHATGTSAPQAATPSSPRRPGPPLVASLVVLAIGVVLAVPSAVLVVVRAAGYFTSPALTTPGTATRHLVRGTWMISERTGTRSPIGVTHVSAPTLGPDDVSVMGPTPTSDPVPVSAIRVYETITRRSKVYVAVGVFQIDSSGTYRITVAGPGASEVLITRSLGQTFHDVAAALVVGGLGGALVLTGIVLTIVGTVRRNHAAHRVPPTWGRGPGPGWYPDPGRAGGHRWWDGARWTAHQA